jgi:hypothetical protein
VTIQPNLSPTEHPGKGQIVDCFARPVSSGGVAFFEPAGIDSVPDRWKTRKGPDGQRALRTARSFCRGTFPDFRTVHQTPQRRAMTITSLRVSPVIRIAGMPGQKARS